MGKFMYGFDGKADRQMASLAAVSTMAKQMITTTQMSVIGWNGMEVSNSDSETVTLVS